MAHLLEHLVFKGSPKHTEHSAGAHRARRAPQRHDLVRPHQLLRDASGHRREPRVGARPRSRPHGQLLHRQEGPRQRDDGRPQRVRGGREQPDRRARASACCPPRTSGTTTASSTIGARADIENVPIERLQAFYQQLLPAGQRGAGRRRQVRRGEDARAGRTSTSAPIPRPTRALPTTYTVEPTQDGERSVTLRRVGDVQVVVAVLSRARRRRIPDFARDRRPRRACSATRRRAGCYKALVETEEGRRGRRLQLSAAASPACSLFGAKCARSSRSTRRASTLLDDDRGRSATHAGHRGGSRARARRALLKKIELVLNDSERVGLQLSEWIGDGRLAAAVPATATA